MLLSTRALKCVWTILWIFVYIPFHGSSLSLTSWMPVFIIYMNNQTKSSLPVYRQRNNEREFLLMIWLTYSRNRITVINMNYTDTHKADCKVEHLLHDKANRFVTRL